MPSIAKFAYQLTMEEMYGFTAIEEMGHRIMQLNDSQLEGLREHLQKAAFDAKSELWRDANKSVSARPTNRRRAVRWVPFILIYLTYLIASLLMRFGPGAEHIGPRVGSTRGR